MAFELEESSLADIFPSDYQTDLTYSEIGFGNIPCNVQEILEEQGAKLISSTTFDARRSIDDPTYYRAEVVRFEANKKFSELTKPLQMQVESCGYLNDNYIGSVNNFSSESASAGFRDLKDLNIPAQSVVQFEYESSRLVFNSETLYSDGARELAEVFVIHSEEIALIVVLKGRNYKNNSAQFPFLEKLITTTLEGFKQ